VQQRPPRAMWNKFKAALLDIFTDELTLLTPTGAWFDPPVHQDPKWLLNVWERCIYRQSNGEWSQYPYHTFSRLRFLMTPMSFPRPAQCSHRIQVTQRTQYREVTAKVTSQDTVPTVLHSYTSGIVLGKEV
jgi:hypothetical protein